MEREKKGFVLLVLLFISYLDQFQNCAMQYSNLLEKVETPKYVNHICVCVCVCVCVYVCACVCVCACACAHVHVCVTDCGVCVCVCMCVFVCMCIHLHVCFVHIILYVI